MRLRASLAALPAHVPTQPIDPVILNSFSCSTNLLEQNWDLRSGISVVSTGARRATVFRSAATARLAVILESIE